MYESFYQLTTNPFRLAPDPDFCFSHSGYKSAREYLEYALDQGEGFVMVTGRPGTGKTLLVETFLREIDVNKVIAKRIAVSNYGADELLRAVAYAYDIDVAEADKATLRHRIQEYFLQQEQAGRRVVLIMDEAQALQHSALEELRILADLQTQSRTMLQLFLVGQKSLQDLMSTPEMEQFQQRVIANYHLTPLSLPEARAYIEHRLLRAGWSGDPEFTSAAVLAIYQLGKGVPRHINKICNRLLLLGFGKGSYILDKEDVQTISTEMQVELLTPMNSIQETLFSDADSIPEIRDGLISPSDLAIRLDTVDAKAFAISEASRLATLQKEQFIARHKDDPATWYPHTSSPANPVEDSVTDTTEQLSGPATAAADDHQHESVVAGLFAGRFKWNRDVLAVTVATLAIATLSFASLPSFVGNDSAKDALSQTELPSRETSATTETGSHDAPDDRGVQEISPDMHEDDILLATEEIPEDTSISWDTLPEPVDTALINNKLVSVQQPVILQPLLVDYLNEHLSPQQDWQPVPGASVHTDSDAATPGQYDFSVDNTVAGDLSEEAPATSHDRSDKAMEQHAIAGFQPPSGEINRRSLPQQPPVIAGHVEAATVPEMVALTDSTKDKSIMELLSLGQQSISDYRLLTPQDDNAYGYFQAVLSRDPDNEDAHAGIQEIVDLYVTFTHKAANRHDYRRAGRYVDRGLSIQPDHRELLALKGGIDGRMMRTSNGVPASQRSVRARERVAHESMMSRITTFFNKRKAEAERGEVTVPAGWDS